MKTENTINSLLECIRSTLFTNLNSKSYLFLTRKYTPYENYEIEEHNLKIAWHGNAELLEFDKPYRIYTHKYTRNFSLSGNIRYKSSDSGLVVDVHYSENLTVEAIIDFVKEIFSFDIFDEDKLLLKRFNDKVIDTCKTNNLYGFDDCNLKIDGKGLSSFFTEITRRERTNTFPKPFHDFNVFNDLTRVTQDIRFLIGQLILYKPYITDYLSGKTNWNGKIMFKYFPNRFDKRYFMTCGLLVELLYNYWDKIGDLLDNCFGVIQQRRNIYFGTVISNIPNQYHTSQNHIWLNNFNDNEYAELISKRNKIVHYTAIESGFFEQYMGNYKNETEIKKLQEEKEDITDYLINHNKLVFEGFKKALKLIDEIE